MSQITDTLNTINFIRLEKQPPIGRFCALLVLAESGKAMTGHAIAKRIGDTSQRSSTLESAERLGFLTSALKDGKTLWKLTPNGKSEVQRILNTCHNHSSPSLK